MEKIMLFEERDCDECGGQGTIGLRDGEIRDCPVCYGEGYGTYKAGTITLKKLKIMLEEIE